jgi:D-alanyl-D-alanine carboxypeptidase (penicillin-binding protein 5/6)
MSSHLIKYPLITKYSSLWQDSIRNGEFILTNTNRLVRYYDGCNGLKTGSTDKAGYCISATAKRGDMSLIAVVLGAESRDKRNEAARELLDFGFSNYAVYKFDEKFIESVPVYSGKRESADIYSREFITLVDKSKHSLVEIKYDIPEYISAPVCENEVVGEIKFYLENEEIGKAELFIKEGVEKMSILDAFLMIIFKIISGK